MSDLRFYDYRTQDLMITVTEHERLMKARAAKVPSWVFDGYKVYSKLSGKAKQRTSTENVSDVLDAINAMLNKEGA